jgi:hypothetical protein
VVRISYSTYDPPVDCFKKNIWVRSFLSGRERGIIFNDPMGVYLRLKLPFGFVYFPSLPLEIELLSAFR